jgi:hypothetical protein
MRPDPGGKKLPRPGARGNRGQRRWNSAPELRASGNAVMQVTWFRHGDEHRNDLLRFGLMKLHRSKQLSFAEYPLPSCADFGFASSVSNSAPHHVSLLHIATGAQSIKCLVDSEDSFFWMSPLISEVDVYFCSGYNSDFFVNKTFISPYSWLKDIEVSFYYGRAAELIQRYGDEFKKVRRFVPIGPALSVGVERSFLSRKLQNLRYRMGSLRSTGLYWGLDFEAFQARYAALTTMRRSALVYDVVLLDTLWGWPRHRLALHRRLAELSSKFKICSQLTWSAPVPFDGSLEEPLDKALFPVITHPVTGYEGMLASSRLGVFATGFHWGWRSIMCLAMLFGLPIFTDRLLVEPWFGVDEFGWMFNDAGDWRDLEANLGRITEIDWKSTKACNQALYDKFMSPEAVATYFIETAMSHRPGAN